jgi:hypothetical protein
MAVWLPLVSLATATMLLPLLLPLLMPHAACGWKDRMGAA